MEKIPTIFKRDFNNNGKITRDYDDHVEGFVYEEALPTEKMDGTNVRLTVRNHTLVRLEKRRNPDKIQKAKGILEPWYVDADEFDASDKYMWEAARNTDLSALEDGEYSGEALGPSIQGNPLKLDKHTVFLFSVDSILRNYVFTDAPHTYDELKEWLPKQKSKFGNDCFIEGIVWHHPNGRMAKIKAKDFL